MEEHWAQEMLKILKGIESKLEMLTRIESECKTLNSKIDKITERLGGEQAPAEATLI